MFRIIRQVGRSRLRQNTFSGQTRRGVRSQQHALQLLGLESESFTIKEVRFAYLTKAKECHPDTATMDDGGERFRQLTRAYERLTQQASPDEQAMLVTDKEEQDFRLACQQVLGLPAEVVEESKRNPLFRQWLRGRTDGAQFWRNFLLQHGGLAPKIKPQAKIASGGGKASPRPRRRRPGR